MKALEVLLGYDCNVKCLFCSQEDSWRLRPGLPFGLVARELYRAAQDGYRSVCFTGGEPTLRKDLPTMAALARRLGFSYIRVQTNGLRLAEEGFARSLVSAGANFFRFSILGHTPELHDPLVRVPGALAKVWRAVAHVRALGAGVGVNVVLGAANHRRLADICADFLERGLSNIVIIYPLYEGDMAAHEGALRLSMAEAAESARAAFEVFRARGAPEPRLLNFTPCAAPKLAPWMLNWSAPSALVVDGKGRPVDLYMASHDDRAKPGFCGACAFDADCLGLKHAYLARFPDGGGLGAVPRRPKRPSRPAGAERVLQDGRELFGTAPSEIARVVQPVPERRGPAEPLRVERTRLRLDPARGRLEEERFEWTVAA